MKFVFISSLVPVEHPKSGYDIANRVIVNGLRELGIDVHIIGFLTPGEKPAFPNHTSVLGELQVTNTRVGLSQKVAWLLRAILTGVPVSVAKMRTASQKDLNDKLNAIRPFDGIIFNSVQLPGAFVDLLKKDRSIFVAHNVESQSALRNAEGARNLLSSILFRREAKLLHKIEQSLCTSSEHVWTLAEQDRFDLNVEEKSSSLPLVTTSNDNVQTEAAKKDYDVGLIGSWSWAANRHGLDWFLEQVVPQLPDHISVAIAGNIGKKPENVPSHIQFLGRVDDAQEFVRSCRVIPLISREGTGVQLKTLETFELGLPSVATQNAVRGIDQVPANCVLVDNCTDFAEALNKLVCQSRDGDDLNLDGSVFHKKQKQALLEALHNGLLAAGFVTGQEQEVA